MMDIREEPGSIITAPHKFCKQILGLNHLMSLSLDIENNTFIPDFVSSNNLKRLHITLTAGYSYEVTRLTKILSQGTLFRCGQYFKAILRKSGLIT
jgi:hypothetical protein